GFHRFFTRWSVVCRGYRGRECLAVGSGEFAHGTEATQGRLIRTVRFGIFGGQPTIVHQRSRSSGASVGFGHVAATPPASRPRERDVVAGSGTGWPAHRG